MIIQIKRKRLFWYWRILSSNGQVMGTSETYFSKGNAKRAGRKVAKALNLKLVET